MPSKPSRTRFQSTVLAAACATAVLLTGALPAHAYPGCSDGTPAASVPDDLWKGGLRPAADKPFQDGTRYNGNQLPDHRYPLFSSLDVENGRLFASYTGGFGMWNLDEDPANPSSKSIIDARSNAYLRPITWYSEQREFFWDIDAPAGNDDVAVLVGVASVGLSVWDTTNIKNPTNVYHDSALQGNGKDLWGVHTAQVGGRIYAFAVAAGQHDSGLHYWDVSRALANKEGCDENSFDSSSCGVYKGAMMNGHLRYISGVPYGDGVLLAVSGGKDVSAGVHLFNVQPTASGLTYEKVLTGLETAGTLQGNALWKDGSSYYMAIRTFQQAQIYDITSCVSGNCSSLNGREVGAPFNLGFHSGWQSVTFSRAGHPTTGKPFLYFGNDAKCHSGLKKEWLYDISSLTNPKEITGNATMVVTADDGVSATVDYWSYYYGRNPSGFSQIMPRKGLFAGNHFYRAAWTILEAHELTSVEPSVSVDGPGAVYQDGPETYTASALNCTPSAGGWSWDAGNSGTVTGTGATVQVSWSSTGTKSLTVGNSGCGSAQAGLTVKVNDPSPVIGAVTASPSTAFVCQPITFQASGVGGKAPLARAWKVTPASGGTPIALASTTDTALWNTSAATTPGVYSGALTVSGTGDPATKSATVTLQALPILPAGGQFTPTFGDFAASTVQFSVVALGATEWSWDFGDGQGYRAWSNDPVTGPAPQHTYTEADVAAVCNGNLPCTFPVKVKVRNCVETERESNVAEVQVEQINPLAITTFFACSGWRCSYEVNENIEFDLVVTGDPTDYQFDWDGNGTYEDTTTEPVNGKVTHKYSTKGTYTPKLKVVRGSESETATHASISVASAEPPPPPPAQKKITVTGPASGKVGEALTFTASASGCTAGTTSWSWNTGGGAGSSSSKTITVTWSTAGTKKVTATNSGCSGVSGSRNLSISEEGGGGGGGTGGGANPVANFTYAPVAPKAGEEVTFDGGPSTGTPEIYFWRIGGKEYAAKTVKHTFEAPGSYEVFLEVSKKDEACSQGLCSDSEKKTVVVTGEPLDTGSGNGCTGAAKDDPRLLCLQGGRFEVKVDWTNQFNGDQKGVGTAVRHAGSDLTGFYWFFNPNNIELIVKVLDGSPVNGNIWVFYGALTNVGYTIEVKDNASGQVKRYQNLPGTICGVGDTTAFPSTAASTTGNSAFGVMEFEGGGAAAGSVESTTAEAVGVPTSADALYLLDQRFKVEVDWNTRDATSGSGTPVEGTQQSGYFWFFRPENLELVVKMVDGRAANGHFWVFYGGLSNVQYTMKITDLETGEEWTAVNPQGSICGGFDTEAF